MNKINDIIGPETDLEKQIITDPEFIQGVMWGKPRPGHPEGEIIYHICEVLINVDKYSSGDIRESLRFIAIIHDSFKYKVDYSKPKSGENHHAMIARRFAEKYTDDGDILDIIELHDEAYNSWSIGTRHGDWSKAEKRAFKLIERLKSNLYLYTMFYKCDSETGNKRNDDYKWFNKFI